MQSTDNHPTKSPATSLPVSPKIWVLGEALMDCVSQADGSLRPLMGGSPFNMARAAALRLTDTAAQGLAGGKPVEVGFINPFSTDRFGDLLRAQLAHDGVRILLPASPLPTSLAVVQISGGQPSYGFYREGIADRDYTSEQVLALLEAEQPGVLHTGSLLLVPPEHHKVITILLGAKRLGWTVSVDVNLRPKLAADLGAYVKAVHQVAALADWLKASDEDLELLGFPSPRRSHAAAIAAEFKTRVASPGLRRLALTFGASGAWLDVDGHSAEAEVPAVQVVDTVGAGDTFWGNCLGAWVLHDTNPDEPNAAAAHVAGTLQESMRAAAINCSRTGCQPPRYAETLAAMQ